MSSSPTISASGFCGTCGTAHSLGKGNSRKYALELMRQLDTFKRVDDRSNPLFSTNPLFSEARGHMFGVLECEDTDGKPLPKCNGESRQTANERPESVAINNFQQKIMNEVNG